MGQVLATNQAWGLLSTAISTANTSITLQSGQAALFPTIVVGSGNWFYITITDANNNVERCQVTATSGDQFTVVRGVDGSSPLAFASGARVELRWNAAVITDLQTQMATLNTTTNATITALKSALNVAFPVGTIHLWNGSVASIPSGWVLCNGSNGSPDLRDRFIVGAGNTYGPGWVGGATTATLNWNNMPPHNHGINDPGHNHYVNDPGHNHGVNDPGHNHGVNDPGHYHGFPRYAGWTGGGGTDGTADGGQVGDGNSYTQRTGISLNASGTGIWLNGSGTGIYLSGSGTGISTQNAGSGSAFGILPPYYGLCYIMRTGTFT